VNPARDLRDALPEVHPLGNLSSYQVIDLIGHPDQPVPDLGQVGRGERALFPRELPAEEHFVRRTHRGPDRAPDHLVNSGGPGGGPSPDHLQVRALAPEHAAGGLHQPAGQGGPEGTPNQALSGPGVDPGVQPGREPRVPTTPIPDRLSHVGTPTGSGSRPWPRLAMDSAAYNRSSWWAMPRVNSSNTYPRSNRPRSSAFTPRSRATSGRWSQAPAVTFTALSGVIGPTRTCSSWRGTSAHRPRRSAGVVSRPPASSNARRTINFEAALNTCWGLGGGVGRAVMAISAIRSFRRASMACAARRSSAAVSARFEPGSGSSSDGPSSKVSGISSPVSSSSSPEEIPGRRPDTGMADRPEIPRMAWTPGSDNRVGAWATARRMIIRARSSLLGIWSGLKAPAFTASSSEIRKRS